MSRRLKLLPKIEGDSVHCWNSFLSSAAFIKILHLFVGNLKSSRLPKNLCENFFLACSGLLSDTFRQEHSTGMEKATGISPSPPSI